MSLSGHEFSYTVTLGVSVTVSRFLLCLSGDEEGSSSAADTTSVSPLINHVPDRRLYRIWPIFQTSANVFSDVDN